MTLAGSLLLALGALLLLLASIGLFSLRDALSRQHAATKAGSLAVACIVLGAALREQAETIERERLPLFERDDRAA